MNTDIIVAIIAASGGAIGTVIGILANTKLVTYRIGQLENKVNEHNNLIIRTYEIERKMDVQEEKIKVANHRIDDLEESGGK